MTKIVHISDLHFGRPAVDIHLQSLRSNIEALRPDAIAVSGDLTQRCAVREFRKARQYLDRLGESAPVIVIPGNHDIRWLGAVARNLGLFDIHAHEYKYSRYTQFISEELSPSLRVPGATIAGLNTAHGISRGSLTRRLRDLGVIGHVKRADVEKVKKLFSHAPPTDARIVMIHHNPIKGETTGRHGLANTDEALHSLSEAGAELILCGHDHQEAIHTAEEMTMDTPPNTSPSINPNLIISTAGTISNRLRAGRPASFNLVETSAESIKIVTHTLRKNDFQPSQSFSFERRRGSRIA